MGKRKPAENNEELVNIIVSAIQDKKGQSIVKIDLREIKNILCDYFVICQCESNTQVKAVSENIEREAYMKLKIEPHHIEGRENAQWILIDFFDVVVHVFQKEYRSFYKLEDLWSDGKTEVIKDLI
jgi:ribosome-associated protein